MAGFFKTALKIAKQIEKQNKEQQRAIERYHKFLQTVETRSSSVHFRYLKQMYKIESALDAAETELQETEELVEELAHEILLWETRIRAATKDGASKAVLSNLNHNLKQTQKEHGKAEKQIEKKRLKVRACEDKEDEFEPEYWFNFWDFLDGSEFVEHVWSANQNKSIGNIRNQYPQEVQDALHRGIRSAVSRLKEEEVFCASSVSSITEIDFL